MEKKPTKNLIKKQWPIYIVIIALLSSCAPKTEGPSIFSGQLCGGLCWNHVIVGETGKQEFIEIALTLPNVDQSTLVSRVYADGSIFDEEISFEYYRNSNDNTSLVNVVAETINQKIATLTFYGDLGLTFQDVEDEFGEPNNVTSFWHLAEPGINVIFINSVNGVEIQSYFKSEKSVVKPNTEVNYLYLFTPDLYSKLLESDHLIPDHEGLTFYQWYGYGKIGELYQPQ
jgi:hypothetical protein